MMRFSCPRAPQLRTSSWKNGSTAKPEERLVSHISTFSLSTASKAEQSTANALFRLLPGGFLVRAQAGDQNSASGNPIISWLPWLRGDYQRHHLRARGVLEIAGCFAFWISLRRGVTPFVAVLGVVSLIAFAVALTRVDSALPHERMPRTAGSTSLGRVCGFGRLKDKHRRAPT